MRVEIKEQKDSYEINIKKGIINSCGKYINHAGKCIIVTDSGVPEQYIKTVSEQINCAGVYTFPKGEKNKNLKTLAKILDEMQNLNLNRGDFAVAIGGGVVGDITAFASSIYMRGIDFYNIPTTFLAMVDSSIGGKTGIDYNGIKNSIGTFHQPRKVLSDPNVLQTLSKRQYLQGLCESIKMFALFSKEDFEYLENTKPSKYDLDFIINESCSQKCDIVMKDTKEKNLRMLLNFGHTLGHGIEESCGGKLLHGECVGLGMIAMTDGETKERIIKLLEKLHLPVKAKFDIDKTIELVTHDKKSTSEGVKCVVLNEIGDYEIIVKGRKELYDRLKTVSED